MDNIPNNIIIFKMLLNSEQSFLDFENHNLYKKQSSGATIKIITYPKTKVLLLIICNMIKRKTNKIAPKKKATLEALFLPIIIGKVLHLSFKSPLISSMSFIISLTKVVKNAKKEYPITDQKGKKILK